MQDAVSTEIEKRNTHCSMARIQASPMNSRLVPVAKPDPTSSRASHVQSTSKEHSAPSGALIIMAQPSAAKFILKRPWLKRWMMPLANWYGNAAGYRQLGLRYDSTFPTFDLPFQVPIDIRHGVIDNILCYRADDLIPEESETVMLAIKRLPPKEAYDRVFRMRRAFQVRQSISLIEVTLLTHHSCPCPISCSRRKNGQSLKTYVKGHFSAQSVC